MSEQQQVPEYRQGDTVSLTVELRDDKGVYHVRTAALIEGETSANTHPDRKVDLSGWPEESTTHAKVTLTATIEQQEPGLYFCYAIVATNEYQALTRHELEAPLQLRIVEHPDDVREGPEVLSVGTFQ